MFDIMEECVKTVTNQNEFQREFINPPKIPDLLNGDKSAVILLEPKTLVIDHDLIDSMAYITTPIIRGLGKTNINLVGKSYSLRTHKDINRIQLLNTAFDGVTLLSDQPIVVSVSDRCLSNWKNVTLGENVTTINIDHDIEDELPVSVYNQNDFDVAIENQVSEIHLYGEIFTLRNDAGLHKIIGKSEQTIIILEGDDGCSVRLNSNFETVDIKVLEPMFLTLENVIISSVERTEIPFTSREDFDSWKNVIYDTNKIDVAITEDEFNELNIAMNQQNEDDLAFLRKYQVRLVGIDGVQPNNSSEHSALSYQEACSTYQDTNLKVGGVIGAKLKQGYYRYGIFGGKECIISTDLETDVVSILNHEDFLEGTGFFNATQVYRMGFEGDGINKSLEESYNTAISLLGEEHDDEVFVKLCRLEVGDDREPECVDSDFLSEL